MAVLFNKEKDLIQLYSTPLGRFRLSDAKELTPRFLADLVKTQSASPA